MYKQKVSSYTLGTEFSFTVSINIFYWLVNPNQNLSEEFKDFLYNSKTFQRPQRHMHSNLIRTLKTLTVFQSGIALVAVFHVHHCQVVQKI